MGDLPVSTNSIEQPVASECPETHIRDPDDGVCYPKITLFKFVEVDLDGELVEPSVKLGQSLSIPQRKCDEFMADPDGLERWKECILRYFEDPKAPSEVSDSQTEIEAIIAPEVIEPAPQTRSQGRVLRGNFGNNRSLWSINFSAPLSTFGIYTEKEYDNVFLGVTPLIGAEASFYRVSEAETEYAGNLCNPFRGASIFVNIGQAFLIDHSQEEDVYPRSSRADFGVGVSSGFKTVKDSKLVYTLLGLRVAMVNYFTPVTSSPVESLSSHPLISARLGFGYENFGFFFQHGWLLGGNFQDGECSRFSCGVDTMFGIDTGF